MMFSSDNDIFHTRFLCESYPLRGYKFFWVKWFRKLGILLTGNSAPIHQPLWIPWNSPTLPYTSSDWIQTPVDKHAILSFSPPTHSVFRIHSSCHLVPRRYLPDCSAFGGISRMPLVSLSIICAPERTWTSTPFKVYGPKPYASTIPPREHTFRLHYTL